MTKLEESTQKTTTDLNCVLKKWPIRFYRRYATK